MSKFKNGPSQGHDGFHYMDLIQVIKLNIVAIWPQIVRITSFCIVEFPPLTYVSTTKNLEQKQTSNAKLDKKRE